MKKLMMLAVLLALVAALAAPAMAQAKMRPQVGCSGNGCWPRYSFGDQDTDVTAVQYFLIDRHFATFKPNGGYYGAQTVSAVKSFQKANNLPMSGVMFAGSWQKLVVPVHFGQTNSAVKALQTELQQQYGYNIPVTGFYGNITRSDVADFQKKHGLKVNGSAVGPVTWHSIISSR